MSDPILHAYDASPFTQRALRMLGFKNLDWRWVETPMMLPKDDLIALTGGYRGTPVLQIGNDVYVDSRLIALELERRFPEPSLFPAGNAGIALALVGWSDLFFRAALKVILATSSHTWPEAFRKDREAVFQDIDFASVGADLEHAKSQYRAHAWFLERQLADGRDFIGGARPGFADAIAWPVIWVMRGNLPAIATELLGDFRHLAPWEERIKQQGEGRRMRIAAAAALAEAKASPPHASPSPSNPHAGVQSHASGITPRPGTQVSITPDDTCRGGVSGEVVASGPDEIAVLRSSEQTGPVVVHFPRAGYRISAAPAT